MVDMEPLEYPSGPVPAALPLSWVEIVSGIGMVLLLGAGEKDVLSSESESTAMGWYRLFIACLWLWRYLSHSDTRLGLPEWLLRSLAIAM